MAELSCLHNGEELDEELGWACPEHRISPVCNLHHKRTAIILLNKR